MSRLAYAALIAGLIATPALAAPDGATLFGQQCKICHQAKSSPLAPSLIGVYGRKMGSLPDFNYSPGVKAKGGVWNDANLDKWLSGPSAFIPGAKMVINVPAAENRAAVIGYLKTLK